MNSGKMEDFLIIDEHLSINNQYLSVYNNAKGGSFSYF
jgi:hypothetical protein